MNQEQRKFLAIKFGVPLPESCMLLKPNNTIFFWYQKNGDWKLIANTDLDKHFDEIPVKDPNLHPAPQVHELMPLLPAIVADAYLDIISYKDEESNLVKYVQYTKHDCSSSLECYDDLRIQVEENHYAEALAQMYHKLIADDLLS